MLPHSGVSIKSSESRQFKTRKTVLARTRETTVKEIRSTIGGVLQVWPQHLSQHRLDRF